MGMPLKYVMFVRNSTQFLKVHRTFVMCNDFSLNVWRQVTIFFVWFLSSISRPDVDCLATTQFFCSLHLFINGKIELNNRHPEKKNSLLHYSEQKLFDVGFYLREIIVDYYL